MVVGKQGRTVASSQRKSAKGSNPPATVQAARDLLARHHQFRGRIDQFDFVQQGEILTVRGSVPTFHLKQLLQCILKDIDGVGRIDNQVDVTRTESSSDVAKHGARPSQ